MSTREIAPVVNAGKSTVDRDLGVPSGTGRSFRIPGSIDEVKAAFTDTDVQIPPGLTLVQEIIYLEQMADAYEKRAARLMGQPVQTGPENIEALRIRFRSGNISGKLIGRLIDLHVPEDCTLREFAAAADVPYKTMLHYWQEYKADKRQKDG